jgi:uncharacterized membrane protein
MSLFADFNFHPPLSSVPIVLLVSVGLGELLRCIRPDWISLSAVRFNLVLATGAVILAFLSGYQGNEFANGTFKVSDEVIAVHHFWGRLLLFMVVPCLALECIAARAQFAVKVFRGLYLLLLVACISVAIYTGWLGGQLVFEHGAGVVAVPTLAAE